MRSVDFGYVAPGSVGAVIELLRTDAGSMLLGGGQSLVPLVNRRELTPSVLIDLERVVGLDRLDLEPQRTLVGAQVRLGRLVSDRAVAERHPGLVEALRTVGDSEVRRRATVGGTLGYADPRSQVLVVVAALGGAVQVEGPDGTRMLSVADLVVGRHRTSLSRGELIVGLELPLTPHAQGIAVTGREGRGGRVCAAVVLDDGGPLYAAIGGMGDRLLMLDRDMLTEGPADHVAATGASAYEVRLALVTFDRAVTDAKRPVLR